jgi:hypothetical protein
MPLARSEKSRSSPWEYPTIVSSNRTERTTSVRHIIAQPGSQSPSTGAAVGPPNVHGTEIPDREYVPGRRLGTIPRARRRRHSRVGASNWFVL